MQSSLPLPSPIDGYVRFLGDFSESDKSSLIYPSSYIVFTSDPSKSIIIEREKKWDTATLKTLYRNSWIHQTEDDGQTWTTIWENKPFDIPDQIFLDEANHSLWCIADIVSDTSSSSYVIGSYLSKLTLKLGISQTQSFFDSNNITSYPNPSNGTINILLPEKAKRILSLTLFETTGKEIVADTKGFLFSHSILQYTISEQVHSGFYFLKINTDHNTYFVKIILQR